MTKWESMQGGGKKIYLPNILQQNGSLELDLLPLGHQTKFISITGQDGSGKTTLRDNLANYFAKQGKIVITAKSPCDKHTVNLLNNAISQNGYEDWYTEQLLFSFMDGLLSNYMVQLKGRCDYFICQRGPIDQYAHGVTRSGKKYSEIYSIQRPERLEKFHVYIHLNCEVKTAWDRIKEDEGKDRYEYFEYFERQVPNTRILYESIINGEEPELNFLRSSENYYIDTTELTTDQVMEKALQLLQQDC